MTRRTGRGVTAAAATALIAFAALALAGCAGTDDAELLESHDLAGLDAKEVVEQLDTLPVAERPTDLIASVQPGELVLTDQTGNEATLAVPEDEFYVSIAPFVEITHDCYFHSLTTCLGELQNTEVDVTITDSETGETLVDEAVRTYDNGFVGFWLPADIDAEVTIEYDGRTASAPLATGDEDPTCITTLQLQ